MKKESTFETKERTDQEIIHVLRDAADSDSVFTATKEWSLEKTRLSVHSRGDFFDRAGVLVLENDGKEMLRVTRCDLPVTIGRGEKVDCRLDYEGVSRVHCRIESVGNLIRLCDADSKNGTWLNGKLIDHEDLCDGDVIQLGTVSLRAKRC